MICIENVTKVYPTRNGPRVVLDNINLRLSKGEKLGVIGPNGSGKSTLIRLIGGGETPTHGHIRRGMSVSWPLAFAGAFQGNLTGRDNVRFICRVYDAKIEPAIRFVEEFSELGSYLREPVKYYSSGMCAKLAFAISMAVEFDCYLIDEVFAVGDSRFHEKCNRELFEKRGDRAMIIVSHHLEVLRDRCNKFWVMDSGRVREFDKFDLAHEFYARKN